MSSTHDSSCVPAERQALPGILQTLEGTFSSLLGAPVFYESEISNAKCSDDAVEVQPQPQAVPESNPEPEPKGKGKNKVAGKAHKKSAKPPAKTQPDPEHKHEEVLPVEDRPPCQQESKEPDIYDDRIKAIRDRCAAESDDCHTLAQYISTQRQCAALSFSNELADKDRQYTHFWRYAGLPTKPSHLSLDAHQLRPSNLIDPKAIMATVLDEERREVLNPPAVHEFADNTAAPHYLQNTQANTNRVNTKQDLISKARERAQLSSTWNAMSQDERKARIKQTKKQRHLNGLRMTGDQWRQESRIIESIKHKLSFQRNPRFDYMQPKTPKTVVVDPLLNRPKFGVGPLTAPVPSSKQRSIAKEGVAFVCNPEEIVFNTWEAGYVYEVEVKVQNVSSTMRRVRIIPPTSQYFFISQKAYPHTEGLVAPGMHVLLTLRFTPDSLADYHDSFTVDTELARFAVPLRAQRAPVQLSLPKELGLKDTFVGNRRVEQVDVAALSGGGSFRVFPADMWPDRAAEVDLASAQVSEAFRVSPALFTAAPGKDAQLRFEFAPQSEGEHTCEYVLVCDNCHVQRMRLKGRGSVPQLEVTLLDGSACCHQQLTDGLYMPDTVPGSCAQRRLRVRNMAALEIPYQWCWSPRASSRAVCEGGARVRCSSGGGPTENAETRSISSSSEDPDASHCAHSEAADGARVVSISPHQGTFKGNEELEFVISFSPESVQGYDLFAQLLIDPSGPDAAQSAFVSGLETSITGQGAPQPASISPAVINIPSLDLGETATQSARIHNPSAASAVFDISVESADVTVSPMCGTVPPGASVDVTVAVTVHTARPKLTTLVCSFDHGQTLEVVVRVESVLTPAVRSQTAAVNFGLLRWQARGSADIVLHNPSRTASAIWHLSEAPHLTHSQLAQSRSMTACLPAGTDAQARSSCQPTWCSFPVPRGTVGPGERLIVPVSCAADSLGALRSTVCLHSGGRVTHIPVQADVLQPQLALSDKDQRQDLGDTYDGVRVKRSIKIRNLTQLITKWRWCGRHIGRGSEYLGMKLMPACGELAGGAEVDVEIEFSPKAAGEVDVVTAFECEGGMLPAVLQTLSRVHGLAVELAVEDDGARCGKAVQAQQTSGACHGATAAAATDECDSAAGPEERGSSAPRLEADRSLDDSSCTAGAVEAPKRTRIIDFGHEIPIGSTCTRTLMIRNKSGVRADVRVWVDSFAAESVPSGITGGVQSIKRLSARRTGTGIILSDAHERSHPFASKQGAAMMATRSVQDSARQILGDKGLALCVTPAFTHLEPFSEVRCAVHCVNNMVGEYVDTLHCAVGSLPVEDFVVRAGVVGTPVHVQKEARLTPGLRSELSPSLALPFGSVACGVAVRKHFHVFNTSCFDMNIAFRAVAFEKDPCKRWVEVKLSVGGDGNVSLRIEPVTRRDNGAFKVHPEHVRVAKGSSARVRVDFASEEALHHEGFIEGVQTLCTEVRSIHLQLLPRPTPAGSRADLPVEVLLKGGFHPQAAAPRLPMFPLRINVSAMSQQARLDVEGPDDLTWRVHSIHSPASHSSYTHTISLLNTTATPLAFQLATHGPFELLAVEPSVPQTVATFKGSVFFSELVGALDAGRAARKVLFLPPRENAAVRIRFVPRPAPQAEDYQDEGELFVSYLNGDRQRLPLRAYMAHPRLSCKLSSGAPATRVDFGRVHVNAPAVIEVLLTNSSDVDALWQACERGVAANPLSLAEAPEPRSKQFGPFAVIPGQGLIKGQGLAKPVARRVLLKFAPVDSQRQELTVDLTPHKGRECRLTLVGEGTFDETLEFKGQLASL